MKLIANWENKYFVRNPRLKKAMGYVCRCSKIKPFIEVEVERARARVCKLGLALNMAQARAQQVRKLGELFFWARQLAQPQEIWKACLQPGRTGFEPIS